jgi:hypothetical protein
MALALGMIGSVRAAPGPVEQELGQAGQPVRVYLDPSTANVCGTATLTVKVQAVPGLWGAQYVISFDPHKLEVVDADLSKPGIQIYPAEVFAGKATTEQVNTADNTTGVIIYAISLIDPQAEPFFGSGNLGRIVFHVKTTGSSVVSFDARSALSGAGATVIPAEGESATVTQAASCRRMYLPLSYRKWVSRS